MTREEYAIDRRTALKTVGSAVATAGVISGSMGSAAAQQLRVETEDEFLEALENVNSGGTIVVADGEYRFEGKDRRLEVDTKNVDIVGENEQKATITYVNEGDQPGRPTFDVVADKVGIYDLVIRREIDTDIFDGERIAQAVKVGGYQAGGGSEAVISNNRIEFAGTPDKDLQTVGVLVEDPHQGGSVEDVVISNNNIKDFPDRGLWTRGKASKVTVNGNVFSGNTPQVLDDADALDIDKVLDTNGFDKAVAVYTPDSKGKFQPKNTIRANITGGINNAGPGDAVIVGGGPYEESLEIKKDLFLTGFGGVKLKPAENALGISVGGDSTVSIEGFTVLSDGGRGLYAKGAQVNLSNCEFRDVEGGSEAYAVRIGGSGADGSTFQNVTTDGHDNGIVNAGASNVSISNCAFLNSTTANIVISNGASGAKTDVSNVSISGCDIQGAPFGIGVVEKKEFEIAGLSVNDSNIVDNAVSGVFTTTGISINDSNISDNGGVKIPNTDIEGAGIFTTTSISVNDSNIVDNEEYGVYTTSTEPVDATHNWWGSPAGPTRTEDSTLNQGEQTNQAFGDRVSENVEFTPFSPAPTEVYVVKDLIDASSDAQAAGLDASTPQEALEE